MSTGSPATASGTRGTGTRAAGAQAPGRTAGPLRKVLRLGPRRWLFLARVVATAVVHEVVIRTRRLPVAARLAGVALTFGATGPSRDEDGWQLLTVEERERCELALRVIDRRPFDRTCLRRSLLLGTLLRHRRPVLRIGVAKAAGAVAAHAWLEVDGASLDREQSGYRVLDDVATLPGSVRGPAAAPGPAAGAGPVAPAS